MLLTVFHSSPSQVGYLSAPTMHSPDGIRRGHPPSQRRFIVAPLNPLSRISQAVTALQLIVFVHCQWFYKRATPHISQQVTNLNVCGRATDEA